ncbi:MAG TPA: hypothetical protein VLF79_04060 [Candidatus Saccharimonadales bacterium]|nr:hypothetical protein [Candidatus Saccharimonadales bacterium]
MSDLLIHPSTLSQIDKFGRQPSQAILIVGPTGSGKLSLAVTLAERILSIPQGTFGGYPYKLVLNNGDNKSIGIDEIRQLDGFMSLKVPSNEVYNRIIIIEDSHLMTIQAQNALLKLLEEPPEFSVIILTSAKEKALLPTIRSRVQTMVIKQPSLPEVELYFNKKNVDTTTVKRAYAISGGLIGLMQSLVKESDHPLILATQKARQLLSQSVYDRIITIDELAKQPVLVRDTVFILEQMAKISLQSATGSSALKWQAILETAYQAQTALSVSAQPKLVLANLMLGL